MRDIVDRIRSFPVGPADMMDLMREAADEVERLRARLEMDFVWQFIDGAKTKVKVEPGSIPDGIECRNETIKLQDERYERMRDELQQLRAALAEKP